MRLTSTYIVLLMAFSILWGCGGSKDVARERKEEPTWITNRPQDPFAYIGIGVARVKPDGSHLQTAKSAALSDLISEISVEVSSTSLLYQMEQNRQFREEFRAQTELNSFETIDSFELVDSYEAEGYFWTQYRLDKDTYARQRAQRKQAAITRALAYYDMALEAYRANQVQASLTHAFTALSELKPFLNEPISSDNMDGDVAITMYVFIDTLLSDINVTPINDQLVMLRYDDRSVYRDAFVTENSDGVPLPEVPVYLYYTGGFLRETQVKSNDSGIVKTILPAATSDAESHRLEADINFVALAEAATRDPLLRMMITRYPGDGAAVDVAILSPKVYIESVEISEGEHLTNTPIAGALKSFLLRHQYALATSKEEADIFVSIDANSKSYGTRNDMHLSQMNGRITIMNAQGVTTDVIPLDQYQGAQLSTQLASRAAFQKAIRDLQDHEFRKIFLR